MVGIFLPLCLEKLGIRLKSFKKNGDGVHAANGCLMTSRAHYDWWIPSCQDLFYENDFFFSIQFSVVRTLLLVSYVLYPCLTCTLWFLLLLILHPFLLRDSLMAGVVYKRTPYYSFRLIRIFFYPCLVASLRRDINFVKVLSSLLPAAFCYIWRVFLKFLETRQLARRWPVSILWGEV